MAAPQTDPAQERLDQIESVLPSLGGELLDLQSGDLGGATKSNSFDLVTKADTASETRLVAFITEHFGEDAILAEEGSPASHAAEAGVIHPGIYTRVCFCKNALWQATHCGVPTVDPQAD